LVQLTELKILTKSYGKALRLVFRFGIRESIRLVFDSIKQRIEIESAFTLNKREIIGIKSDATWELTTEAIVLR